MKLSKRGISIIFALFTLLVLSVVGVAMFSIVSSGVENAASKVRFDSVLGITEGGIQIGAQAISNDVNTAYQTATPTADGYSGIAYLEGYSSNGVVNAERACLHGTDWQDPTESYCILSAVGSNVAVWEFNQRRNLIGTRIKNLNITIRARHGGGVGDNPRVLFEYSTNGGLAWNPVGASVDINNDTWAYINSVDFNPLVYWNTFMSNGGGDFRIRVSKDSGIRDCEIEWLCLRVTFEVDALTEDWYDDWMDIGTGTPKMVNMALGKGQIESVAIYDESGKLHLNTAQENVFQYLFEYDGVPSGDAANMAASIIDYRNGSIAPSGPFNSVEEIKQLEHGITYYDDIDQDLTAHSWINNETTRPFGESGRAPVNINTASRNVLRAIFKCGINGDADDSDDEDDIAQLADDIISERTTQPFTHMYSSFATQAPTRDTRSFAGFIETRAYLSAAEMGRIRANADATVFNRTLNEDWDGTTMAIGGYQTAPEFSYFSNVFLIRAVGKRGVLSRTIKAVYGHSYDYSSFSLGANGTFKLPTRYPTPASISGYWREEH